ncbi:MAG: zinc ribbon domain-containing protein [Phycisphaerales bacterium]|nr:zinc ribbon domain-containing protein [Phycisphaerales bacterium]
MPLRVRCPHCFEAVVVPDAVAGGVHPCPECGVSFTVPLPRHVLDALLPEPDSASPMEGRICPRCKHELGPTATLCRRCAYDLVAGRRLPLRGRLALWPWHRWVTLVLGSGVALLLLWIAANTWWIRTRPASPELFVDRPQTVPGAELAAALLGARTAEERAAALSAYHGVSIPAAPALAEALGAVLDAPGRDVPKLLACIAALDLLSGVGTEHPGQLAAWLELLRRAEELSPLRPAALRARALLGDRSVLSDLTAYWLDRLERYLVLERATVADRVGATATALTQAEGELRRAADGLRALARDERAAVEVLQLVCAAYWESWAWLGQERAERFTLAVFELTRPRGDSLAFRPEDVRRFRDLVRGVSESSPPATAAAAGLMLRDRAPQYTNRLHDIADALGRALTEVSAAEQQQLTWTISELRGRMFGPTPRKHPLEVAAGEVATAAAWALPGRALELHAEYPGVPRLRVRATTPERQMEVDLLVQLEGGWELAQHALDRWLSLGLGVTPRLERWLHPGQRAPEYPAVSAALVVVALSNNDGYARELALWREARDQPAWVRALAYTVASSLEARRGELRSGWPAQLELDDIAALDAGRPGWDWFGRVIAAGGPRMRARLEQAPPTVLDSAVRARLMEAVRKAGL